MPLKGSRTTRTRGDVAAAPIVTNGFNWRSDVCWIRARDGKEILGALVAFHRDRGDLKAARTYADKLRSLSP